MSNYGVFSGPHFSVFSSTTGKYGPEKTSYLDTFHAVDHLYENNEDNGEPTNCT